MKAYSFEHALLECLKLLFAHASLYVRVPCTDAFAIDDALRFEDRRVGARWEAQSKADFVSSAADFAQSFTIYRMAVTSYADLPVRNRSRTQSAIERVVVRSASTLFTPADVSIPGCNQEIEFSSGLTGRAQRAEEESPRPERMRTLHSDS